MKRPLVVLAQGTILLLFVALAVSNFQLRRQITAGRMQPGQNRFRAGESLPRFAARDGSNNSVALGGAAQRDTVMVLFAPGCKACDVVLDEVAAKPRPNVTVVSLLPRERSQAESRKVAGKVPLYFVDRIQRSSIASRAHVVPQILRIGAGGKVEEVCTSYPACVAWSGS